MAETRISFTPQELTRISENPRLKSMLEKGDRAAVKNILNARVQGSTGSGGGGTTSTPKPKAKANTGNWLGQINDALRGANKK